MFNYPFKELSVHWCGSDSYELHCSCFGLWSCARFWVFSITCICHVCGCILPPYIVLGWFDLSYVIWVMNHLCCWYSCSIFCHRFIGYSFSSVYSLYQCVTFFMFGYTEFYDHEIGYHWNSLTFILKYIYWLYNRSPLLSLMWMVIVF